MPASYRILRMTAKELLLERAPNWTEDDAEIALRAVERKHQHTDEPGDIIDDWGNLSAMTGTAAGDLMQRLDEEEMAEFGETISEAWGYESPR